MSETSKETKLSQHIESLAPKLPTSPKRIIHTSYCPEMNMFVYANRSIPKFYRYVHFLIITQILKMMIMINIQT